ncbi:hypothetical protein [Bacillus halotolerans]|uniref:hypothetical protein n=1 Tax=Bacillus halotolerans TaxID=260554 RepID=UPI00215993FB|nr:hypothetical protein [Bacillus halotolerans]
MELVKDNGNLVKESDTPFEQFAQDWDWLKTYSRSGVKISSVRAREKEMKHFHLYLGDLSDQPYY